MKKHLSILLALAMSISACVTNVAYADTLTSAQILNQLGLLNGYNGDLMLNKKITRAEAATFLVKLTGKEKEMQAQASTYNTSTFKDVDKNAWYISYVSYCQKNNLIAGYADGTFKPEAFVTEQEFLAMVLKGLGFKSSDFTWSTVFSTAYAKGIVSDAKYGMNVSPLTGFTRANVAEQYYKAIQLPYMNEAIRPIDKMVESGSVDRQKAQTVGMIKEDATKTAIQSVSVKSPTELQVTLNEAVKAVSASQIKVDNSAVVMEIEKVELADHVVKITLKKPMVAGQSAVTFTQLVDMEGNVVSNLSMGFVGYMPTEIASPYFRIAKVEAAGKSTINVYFTQPINIAAEFPMNYQILKGTTIYEDGKDRNLFIGLNPSLKNAVTIYSKEKDFAEGEIYTLKISGLLSSAYGANLNSSQGDSFVFTGSSKSNTGIDLVNVSVVDGMFIDLEFSQPLDRTTALQGFNYSLVNKSNGVPIGPALEVGFNNVQSETNKIVRLRYSSIDASQNYELTINGVYDFLKVIKLDKYAVPFPGSANKTQGFKIDAAIASDQTRVALYFNKGLNQTTALTTPIIFSTGNTVVSRYFDPAMPYQLILFLDDATPLTASNATVTVFAGMKDFVGYTMTSSTTANVTPSSALGKAPSVTEALKVSANQILVTFNGEFDQSSTTVPAKYTLEYKEGSNSISKTPSNVGAVLGNRVLLTFDALSDTTEYTLKVGTISDYSQQYNSSLQSIAVSR